jgi:hypothetical protein
MVVPMVVLPTTFTTTVSRVVLVVVSRDPVPSWARVAGSWVSILSEEGVPVSSDAWVSSWDRVYRFQGNRVRRSTYVHDFLLAFPFRFSAQALITEPWASCGQAAGILFAVGYLVGCRGPVILPSAAALTLSLAVS